MKPTWKDAPMVMKRRELICPYCNQPADRVTGEVIYPHRPDLADKKFYRCAPCAAWVGCHPGTSRPLGRLANAQLRDAKQRAHRAFDPLWKDGTMSRREAYSWLADRMGIPVTDCHIGEFDIEQCRRVVEVCHETP